MKRLLYIVAVLFFLSSAPLVWHDSPWPAPDPYDRCNYAACPWCDDKCSDPPPAPAKKQKQTKKEGSK